MLPMVLGEPPHEQILRPVRVLVLVHHHVAELARVPRADVLGLLHQLHGLEQQVVEIERVALGSASR